MIGLTFPEEGDGLGSALVVADLNGDGFDDLAVGATGETLNGNTAAGVEYVFDTVSQQGRVSSKEFQTAVYRYFKDKIVITDSAEFEMAYDAFEEFLNDGDLAKGFQYTIDEYEESEGGFLFFGTANGQKYELVVPEKRAFRWRVAPKSGF